jgi:hypothetical protein
MTQPTNPIQKLTALFQQQPCWRIEPLGQQLQCSIISVRRLLAKIGYYSSFTHNGGWYTLASIARFSRDGLWFFQDIGFSRAGSLTQTLVVLISASPAGLSAEQLGQVLHCRCHSVLVHLWRKGLIQRYRPGRSHIYLSADAAVAAAQQRAGQPVAAVPLPAQIAVLVLAEFIRHPQAQAQQLATAVSVKTGLHIQAGQIQGLFDQHGIKKMLR